LLRHIFAGRVTIPALVSGIPNKALNPATGTFAPVFARERFTPFAGLAKAYFTVQPAAHPAMNFNQVCRTVHSFDPVLAHEPSL
jgi:hypothetical protein